MSGSSQAASQATPGASPQADRPAFKSPLAVIVFVVIAVSALVGDLASKQSVFDSMLSDPASQASLAESKAYNPQMTAREALVFFRKDILPGVQFSLSTNKGVAFGISAPRLLVACITVLTVGLIGYYFATSPAGGRSTHVALALILAGAVGNLYDRLFSIVTVPGFEPIKYQVRDFVDCSGLHYPWIFNAADAYLVVGVAVIILQMIVAHRKQSKAAAQGRTS